jgi:uncharacterized protein (TIGR02996 family)
LVGAIIVDPPSPPLTLPIAKGCSIPIPIGSAVDVVANIWRETLDEEVARRLIVLSEEHASYFRPHLPKKGPMFNELVEHRVDSVLSLLLRSVTHGTDGSAAARVRAIFAKWGPDPRVRMYVDRWSNAHPYPSGWEFTTALTEIFGQWSAREAEAKPRALNEIDHKLLGQVDNVLASLPKRRLALELLNDVYTHPTDIQRRLVLADALMDLGDSWGELIALQCKEGVGPVSRPAAKKSREEELIGANKATWLGRLAPWVQDVVFEQGFPSVVSPIFMPRSMGLIEWSTVRQLAPRKVAYYGPELWTLSLLARLPCLREAQAVLVTPRNRPYPHLAFRNTNLEHLSVRIAAYNTTAREQAITSMRGVRTFPNLKRIDFVDYGIATNIEQFNSILNLKNSRFGKSIREIGLNDSLLRILERTTDRMAQRQSLPTFHSLVDLSTFQFDATKRELWLIIGKAIDMRGLAKLFKDAKVESVRVEANSGDAYKRVESESSAWQSSLGATTKIEVKKRAAAPAN